MRFGSDSGWRPLERIDLVVTGPRGFWLVRAVQWWAPCRTTTSSVTVRRIGAERRDIVGGIGLGRDLAIRPESRVVDPGLHWDEHGGFRLIRVPSLGVDVSVRVPRRNHRRPRAGVSRVPRWVRIRPTPSAQEDDTSLRPGGHPGLYTRWPIMADTEPGERLTLVPNRIATGPATLFRDRDDSHLVG